MKILMIETDPYLQNLMRKHLENVGHEVSVFEDLGQAIEEIEKKGDAYKLVICDFTMPESGLTSEIFLETVRTEHPELKLLVLYTEGESENLEKSLVLSKDDSLMKPFSLEDFNKKVNSLLQQNIEVTHEASKRAENDTKEPSEQLEDIHLTPKESAIFEFLAKHPNEVLSRETIFEHVWNFDSKSISNVIDVHMKNLRKKFKSKGKGNMIETVWGLGYRFSGNN